MKSCQVCLHSDKPIIHRFGIDVCEACKKFFVRNRTTPFEKLPCRSDGQQQNCPIDARIQRAPCPRCRLAKCLLLGMSNFSKQKKYSGKLQANNCAKNNGNKSSTSQTTTKATSKSSSSSCESVTNNNSSEIMTSPQSTIASSSEQLALLVAASNNNNSQQQNVIPPSPHCLSSVKAERYLRSIVGAAAELSPLQSIRVDDRFLDFVPLNSVDEEFCVWASGMRAFEWSLPFLMKFFQSLPDINVLSHDSQWHCVNRSLSSLCLAQMTLHFKSMPDFTTFYAFSPRLLERWLTHFPFYMATNKGTDCLAYCLNNFSLSFAEFAFMCAFFVFRDEADVASNTPQMVAIRSAIFDSLQIYLHSTLGGDSKAISAAMVRIFEVVRVLSSLQTETFAAITEMAVAKPHLQMASREWASIYKEKISSSNSSNSSNNNNNNNNVQGNSNNNQQSS